MAANYDTVAPFYDRLSKFVFGDVLIEAQRFTVKAIPENSSILIVGGGTGQILEEIAAVHKAGLNITYIEASGKMIGRAQKKKAGNNRVSFVHQPLEEVDFNNKYDLVVTPFFFDNFSNFTVAKIFIKISLTLKNNALWLFTDFNKEEKESLKNKLLLKLMYRFFRFFCGIEADSLPDVTTLFNSNKYSVVTEQYFLGRFIRSVVYRKNE